jgi:hypothetical protein
MKVEVVMLYIKDYGLDRFKGTVSRDFLLQVFFMNHLPPSPENNIRVISNFFRKLASEGAPPVRGTISTISDC